MTGIPEKIYWSKVPAHKRQQKQEEPDADAAAEPAPEDEITEDQPVAEALEGKSGDVDPSDA